ncbi:DUF4434 domain-containing protein [Thermoactinospora rubra]|uniref:DUF4434 domain-containing protein n=1 Tax=Thermoactinospora rubra TaxID=1088767 RepID=UPI000A0FD666|nr:DUF4434 domain-containing protein [Thermoactinospora rubra]
MRWLTVLLGAVILVAVATVVTVLRGPSEEPPPAKVSAPTPTAAPSEAPTPKVSEFTDPCGSFSSDRKADYAITGYWIMPSSNPCTWRHQLEQIHQVGGDTVIRIGHGLQYRYVDEQGRILKNNEVDPLYEPCVENGVTCVEAAKADLARLGPGNRIARVYVYRSDEGYGPGLFRCPQLEHTIPAGKRVYYRVVAPTDGSDPDSCDFSRPQNYDLILIAAAPPDKDSLTELLELGERFGVRVFPSLPLAPRDPKTPTRANRTHIGTLTTLTRRILQDYGRRFRDNEYLGGVYQPFEVQMSATLAGNPTLEVYASQHDIVEQELPDKEILISPYLDARKRVGFGQTPKQVAEGFKALARTGVGIIAPQDSRGTGKVGLFWPDQRDAEVDERLRPVVGETTYGDAYHGSTRDYYREMSLAREEMMEEGYEVALWANIEAFEPSGDRPCAPQGTRGKTDKKRLDQAVTMAGRYVQKIVSYMWSDFMTCGDPSLSAELVADQDRPIVVDAIRQVESGDGIEVRGYRLDGGTVTLTWSGGSAELPIAMATEALMDLPLRMQSAWVPFDWNQVPPGEWVRLAVRSPAGKETTEPLHIRLQP